MNQDLELLIKFGELRRVVVLYANRILAEIDLTSQQSLLLRLLQKHSLCTVSQLTILSLTDQASVSRTLLGLEKSGYLKRQKSPEDSRAMLLMLTSKGQQKVKKIELKYAEIAKKVFSHLSKKEKQSLESTFIKLKGKVEMFL